MNPNTEFVPYDESFLHRSSTWLSDPEIKQLTLTPDITPESQQKWFDSLPFKNDYLIWGICIDGIPAGACGLKNISAESAEYWGYIGEKQFWGNGAGSKILDFIFEEAIKRKIPAIGLRVWNGNQRAISLYKKFGFEIIENQTELIVMRKLVEIPMFSIRKYEKMDAATWNEFVRSSRNGTFLHNRNYMDYHADRFEDFSLMVFDTNGKLAGIIPANRREHVFYTHQGLTFGGIITQTDMTTAGHLRISDLLNHFLRENGFSKVVFKKIPYIYARQPIDEDRYLMFRNHAKITACNISTTLDLSENFSYNRSRKNAVGKSLKQGLELHKNQHWKEFWNILEENLHQKYGTKPVHSLAEILRLHASFPENIHLFTASKEGKCLGGIVVYESDTVAHAQYISINEAGKTHCALDFILDHLIRTEFSHKKYFDLGSSTEDNGYYLNESLIFQKEGFGGRGVCYETFEYYL